MFGTTAEKAQNNYERSNTARSVEDLKETAKDAAQDAKAMAKDRMKNLREDAEEVGEDLRSAAQQAGKKVRNAVEHAVDETTETAKVVTGYVRSNPIESTLIGLGVGIVVGALLRR